MRKIQIVIRAILIGEVSEQKTGSWSIMWENVKFISEERTKEPNYLNEERL